MIAHDSLHRSGRISRIRLLPRANAHAAQGIRMIEENWRQPVGDDAMHPMPGDMAVLTTAQ